MTSKRINAEEISNTTPKILQDLVPPYFSQTNLPFMLSLISLSSSLSHTEFLSVLPSYLTSSVSPTLPLSYPLGLSPHITSILSKQTEKENQLEKHT